MAFKISAAPGGAQTRTGVALGDLWPTVDVSVGASDNANKTVTTDVLADTARSVSPDLSRMRTPPLATDIGTTWTWLNQGTSTAAQDSAGNLVLTVGQSGTLANVRGLYMSAPGSSFTVTLWYDAAGHGAATVLPGLFVRRSSNGKFHMLGRYANSGTNFKCAQFDSATSQNNDTAVFGLVGIWHTPKALRIVCDGTNVSMFSSADGINFMQHGGAYAVATFLGGVPDQVGFAIDNRNGASVTSSMTVYDFLVV